jgi:hypothetical protein
MLTIYIISLVPIELYSQTDYMRREKYDLIKHSMYRRVLKYRMMRVPGRL